MIPKHRARVNHRDALLDALKSLISEGSVHDVTLEGVAARAGVTKGGLIYHFKSKEALLHGLVERMRHRVDAYCIDTTLEPRAALKNFLISRIDYAFSIDQKEKQVMANLLAAAASYPSLLTPVRAMYDNNGAGSLAGIANSAGLTLSVWTALDGFLLLEMLNIRRFSELERQQMKDNLVALVERQFAAPD
ncbi:TetR family transcriptional regulator [Duganella sp. FT94W]|uniref:TetR family transcriptional regulator n=1 Tax=Duganella lactea TaxID=2692173 RepID=A0ABW9V791_9BURK|nr:TetR/AcrR family transcriptional regulator [Duganella lactea]MYM35193.1 TetR family transcriptional regulator [Duganella lactea]